MKEISTASATRTIRAYRDSNGTPHVFADSHLDGLFGLGYLHAIDRGTQMQFARSVASGRAAEQIADKDELLETDRFFRRVGLYRDLAAEVDLLATDVLDRVCAYCDGVNDGLQELGRSWPMWATKYEAQPWNPESVLLIGKLLSFGGLAVSQMQNERLLMELIHSGAGDDALRELFAPRLDDVDFQLLRQVKMSNKLSDDALELLTDLPRLAGSNAWAVSPSRSATGGALLASDPHLEVNRLPAIWYESILKWGDDFVMGATLPGCPLFAVARTPRLAWGVTYMKGDTIDYFVEQCRRGGETGWQYRRGDEWLDFTRRDESLSRKGGEPDAMGVWSNEQGTLDSDPEELGEGYHLSLAWTGSSPGNGEAIAAWLNVVGSADAVTAMNVVRESCVQPTLCWVFADDGGHIGLQASGRFPRRGGGHTGLTPIPAWEEENHWAGWLPNSVLPRIYDPEEGFLATANQEMNPPDGPLLVTQPLPDYRIRRIVERLSELPAATTSDMEDLQYDVVSLQARDLLEVFLPHMVDGPLKKTLSDWDHRYEPTSREASLFSELYRNVMVQILGSRRAIGFRRMLYLCSRAGFSVMLLTAADRELAKAESRWWAGADKGELIRAAAEPIDVERTMPWSKVNSFHFTDRFFGSHQVGRMLGYNSRKFPMPGCFATPFQGHVLQTATRESTFAPSYHFVTDMSTDEAWTNLPGGASENRFSKYYKSDLARWLSGEYKQLAPLDEPAANQD